MEIVPLHSSLSDKSKVPSQKKKKTEDCIFTGKEVGTESWRTLNARLEGLSFLLWWFEEQWPGEMWMDGWDTGGRAERISRVSGTPLLHAAASQRRVRSGVLQAQDGKLAWWPQSKVRTGSGAVAYTCNPSTLGG